MEKRFISGYRMTPDLVRTSTSLLEEAGRKPGNIERLKEVSLHCAEIDSSTHAFVLPKLRPYAPGPGFDNMIFVAKEGGVVHGIDELEPADLSRILDLGGRVLSVYERNTSRDDLMEKEVLALNYHQNSVSERVFERKLYAQSLRDLHLHVVGFRSSDVEEVPPAQEASSTLKDQYLEIREPFAFFVERLASTPLIQERMSQGLSVLSRTDRHEYLGMSFDASVKDLSDPALSVDLIQLHKNLASVYDDVLRLFADPDRLDASEMPILHSEEQRDERIRSFFAALGEREHRKGDNERLMRAFLSISKRMKSGEDVQALPTKEREQTRIFLRSLAYTMAIIREPSTHALTVTVSPRILSMGNLLATLGYCKVIGDAPPASWIAEKERNEKAITEALGH